MFTYTSGCRSIRLSSVLLFALLFSTASLVQAEDAGAPPATVPGINSPSIEQVLVPEGVFAEQLVEALKLGPVSDGAKAEEFLSGLGIEPKNGWIADYPVTPNVLGDIEKGITNASDQGKIALKKDQALKVVDDVKANLGFGVTPGSKPPTERVEKPGNKTIYTYTDGKGEIHITDNLDSIPQQYRDHVKTRSPLSSKGSTENADDNNSGAGYPQYAANPNPDDMDEYYYDQGPPVVTYYTPPSPYSYLYTWMPFPFWSTGFYFPGFFILNNFYRNVVFNRRPYFVSHHNGGFNQPAVYVAPANRSLPGFTATGAPTNWYRSPNALTGANAIVAFNNNHHRLTGTPAVSQMGGINSPIAFGRGQGFRPHPAFGRDNFGRFHNGGAIGGYNGSGIANHQAYGPNVSRMSRQPNFDNDRVPPSPYRNYGGYAQGGFHHGGGLGGYQGGGNFQGHQGGFFGGGGGGHHGHR